MRNKPTFASIPEASSVPVVAPGAVPGLKAGSSTGIKHVTLRLAVSDWKRLHDFALTHETSLQQLAVLGMSKLMQDAGMQPLEAAKGG
jgi:hypothetical protein